MNLKENNLYLSLKKTHPAGQFLFLAILALPLLRVFLYPNISGSLSYYAFNGLVSFLEIIFISLFILTRRKHSYTLNIFHPLFWVGFLIWVAVVLLAFPHMANPLDGKTMTSQFLIHFIFFITLRSYLNSQPQTGSLFLYAILTAFIIFLPVFLIKLYVIHDQIGFDWAWSLPGFENVRHFDYYLGNIIAILGLFPLWMGQKPLWKSYRLFFIILLIIGWTLIFWSGGRGSSIAAISSLIFLLVCFRPNKWIYFILANFTVMIVGALLSILLPTPHESYGLLRFLTKAENLDNLRVFTAGRSLIWAESFQIWLDNLWIGVGAGQSRSILPSALGVFSQPHNVILQALMAWGIIGGIPFLAAIFIPLITRIKLFYQNQKRMTGVQLIAFGIALSTVINALVDGTLYYSFPLFLFIIAMAIVTTMNYKYK